MKKLESISSPLFKKLEDNKATGLESIYGGIPPKGSGTKTDTGVDNDSKISDMFDVLTGKEKDDHKKTDESKDTPYSGFMVITPQYITNDTTADSIIDLDRDIDVGDIDIISGIEAEYICVCD